MGDRCLLRNVVDAQLLRSVHQQLDNGLSPVGSVTQQTQVRKWLLRASQLAFFLAELVREFDQEFPVAVSLVLGESKNTGNVVIVGGFLLFRKISNNMATM